VTGYLYDWHECPMHEDGYWYVGVVLEELAQFPDIRAASA
jgi:hypothetical protein